VSRMLAILVGVFIAVVSWAPLWIAETIDHYAMPGLDIFAVAGSFVGGVIAVIGLLRLVFDAFTRLEIRFLWFLFRRDAT
jgi:uncharacterized membrane protein